MLNQAGTALVVPESQHELGGLAVEPAHRPPFLGHDLERRFNALCVWLRDSPEQCVDFDFEIPNQLSCTTLSL